MKPIRILWAGLIALSLGLGTSACSKDREPRVDPTSATTQEQAEGQTIALTMEAGWNEGDLRAYYHSPVQGKPVLTLGAPGASASDEKTETVTLFIANKGANGSAGGAQTAIDVQMKVLDGSSLSFSSWKGDGTITLNSGSDNPLDAASGEWYVMGILNGKLNANNDGVEMDSQTLSSIPGVSSTSGETVALEEGKVGVWAFPWTKATIIRTSEGAELQLPKVTFSPLGSMFRISFASTLSSAVQVSDIRLVSNRISLKGTFRPAALEAGAMPIWTSEDANVTLSEGLYHDLPAGYNTTTAEQSLSLTEGGVGINSLGRSDRWVIPAANKPHLYRILRRLCQPPAEVRWLGAGTQA